MLLAWNTDAASYCRCISWACSESSTKSDAKEWIEFPGRERAAFCSSCFMQWHRKHTGNEASQYQVFGGSAKGCIWLPYTAISSDDNIRVWRVTWNLHLYDKGLRLIRRRHWTYCAVTLSFNCCRQILNLVLTLSAAWVQGICFMASCWCRQCWGLAVHLVRTQALSSRNSGWTPLMRIWRPSPWPSKFFW